MGTKTKYKVLFYKTEGGRCPTEVPDNEIEKAQNMMRDFELRIKEGDIKI